MEVEQQYVIDALRDELRTAHENRVLLLAAVNQLAATVERLTTDLAQLRGVPDEGATDADH